MTIYYPVAGLIMRSYRLLPTQRVTVDGTFDEDDFVAIETALEIRLNREFFATLVCSPGLERELSIGHLLSTGIVDSFEDISEVKYSGNRCLIRTRDGIVPKMSKEFTQIRRFIGTECSAPEVLRELRTAEGIPSITRNTRVSLGQILEAARLLHESQTARMKTGALHGALLHCLAESKYSIAEDLGRHNAVDKTIGLALQQEVDPSDCFMVTSGRLTADMVSKCAWTSIPLLVSFSVSTDAGVKFAQKANITLIGALKGNRMRIYNHGACDIG
jgi:FdhD protein